MLLNKIKQNFAGFAAVVIAASGFAAIAPANAAGTAFTIADVGYTSVARTNSTLSSNTITLTATVGADERLSNIYFDADFADSQNQLAIQAGDAIKSQMVYTNLTDGSTASYLYGSSSNYDGWNGTTTYYGNGSGATGSNNTVSRTTSLTSFTAGNYSRVSLWENFNLTDSAISANDNLQFVATYWLVRGGNEIPLPVVSQGMGSNPAYANFNKVATVNHTIGATDSYLNSGYNFCIYRGENGVDFGSVVEITIANTGTAGAFSSSWADMYTYSGGGTVTATSTVGNTRTYTLPASGWDVLRVNGSGYLGSLTTGQTVVPELTAVKQGTSNNIIDTCSRRISGNTAPTVTAAASSIDVTWTAPTHPLSGGTWDSVYVYACETTLSTCGDFPYYGMYGAPTAPTQSWSFRPTAQLSASATSATFSASNTMGYMSGPNQVPSVWSASGSYEYLVMYRDYDSPFMYVSAQSAPIAPTGGGSSSNVQQVAPTLPTTVPLVAPISAPVGGVVLGGALKIDGRNMSSVTSVKIGAVAATTTATVAGLEIKVPTDLAPGKHNLLITTSTGSTLYVDAIKVADPLIVAAQQKIAKAAASIAYRAPIDLTVGKAVSTSQAATAKAFAKQYRDAKSAVCVAIPATKATSAAALAAANKVCATFKAQIPGIKTTVVLGAPSGDKINRVSAEVQG